MGRLEQLTNSVYMIGPELVREILDDDDPHVTARGRREEATELEVGYWRTLESAMAEGRWNDIAKAISIARGIARAGAPWQF